MCYHCIILIKNFVSPQEQARMLKSFRVIFSNLQASVVQNFIFLRKCGMCLYKQVSSLIIRLPPTPF